jgi:hypothetical protein
MRITEHTFLLAGAPEWNSHKSQWADFRKGMQDFIDGLPGDRRDLPSNLDCPFCGSLGPWSGTTCMSCGRMSDPWG